jgi:hypothetical protein
VTAGLDARRRTFEVFPPFSATLVVDYPGNRQLWIRMPPARMEIYIPADRTSVTYRRLLKHMGLSLVYAG